MLYDFEFGQRTLSDTKPTVGRKVWYWTVPMLDDDMISLREDVPFDATVVFVYSQDETYTVNLVVTDHVGNTKFRPQVPVFDLPKWDDEGNEFETEADAVNYLTTTVDESHGIATWMPYQTKQHAQQALDTAAATLMAGETQESLMPEVASQSQVVGADPNLILTDGKDV